MMAKSENNQMEQTTEATTPPAATDSGEDGESQKMKPVYENHELGTLPNESQRPCEHNDWDDVRTRKGFKILRCRQCQKTWKLTSSAPRCMDFLHDSCEAGENCTRLHVSRKKKSVSDRYKEFGEVIYEKQREKEARDREVSLAKITTIESVSLETDSSPMETLEVKRLIAAAVNTVAESEGSIGPQCVSTGESRVNSEKKMLDLVDDICQDAQSKSLPSCRDTNWHEAYSNVVTAPAGSVFATYSKNDFDGFEAEAPEVLPAPSYTSFLWGNFFSD